MNKGCIAVALVAVTWGGACASRPKGAEAGEPETVTMEAEGGASTSTLDCKSGLSVDVDPKDSGKRFKNKGPWKLCSSGTLAVTNTLSSPICVAITDSSGSLYSSGSAAASAGKWETGAPPVGDYTLGVCMQKDGADCSKGCGNMDSAAEAEAPSIGDTIKGNLVVVTSG